MEGGAALRDYVRNRVAQGHGRVAILSSIGVRVEEERLAALEPEAFVSITADLIANPSAHEKGRTAPIIIARSAPQNLKKSPKKIQILPQN